MTFVHELAREPVTIREVLPFDITFEDLDSTLSTNKVKSARRFDLSNSADTGTDIKALTSVTGNKVLLMNIWLDSETPAAGVYQIQILASDATEDTIAEANVVQEVLID
jgi:hypothetical protein